MKKMIETEYVDIVDVQEILKDAERLMENGHYVSVELCNTITEMPTVKVYIMLDGWTYPGEYDYIFSFGMDVRPESVREMNKCAAIINGLILNRRKEK